MHLHSGEALICTCARVNVFRSPHSAQIHLTLEALQKGLMYPLQTEQRASNAASSVYRRDSRSLGSGFSAWKLDEQGVNEGGSALWEAYMFDPSAMRWNGDIRQPKGVPACFITEASIRGESSQQPQQQQTCGSMRSRDEHTMKQTKTDEKRN